MLKQIASTSHWATETIGPNYSGIAAFVLSACAMVIGSLLQPLFQPQRNGEVRSMPEHFFWWLLTMACVVWYSTITVYVSVKGVADIRDMLGRLS